MVWFPVDIDLEITACIFNRVAGYFVVFISRE